MPRIAREAGAPVRLDELDHLVGVGLGCVVVLRKLGEVESVLGKHRSRREGGQIRHIPIAAAAVEQAKVSLEATGARNLLGRFAHVPLASHVGVVARVFKKIWERHDGVVEIAFVTGNPLLVWGDPLVHVAEAVEMRIDPREKHRAGRRTAPMSVEPDGFEKNFRARANGGNWFEIPI